jgi:hypothetical protein
MALSRHWLAAESVHDPGQKNISVNTESKAATNISNVSYFAQTTGRIMCVRIENRTQMAITGYIRQLTQLDTQPANTRRHLSRQSKTTWTSALRRAANHTSTSMICHIGNTMSD